MGDGSVSKGLNRGWRSDSPFGKGSDGKGVVGAFTLAENAVSPRGVSSPIFFADRKWALETRFDEFASFFCAEDDGWDQFVP